MILSESQVRNYLRSAGFKGTDLEKAVQIGFCESGWNTNAHKTTGEDSRGLMQINLNAHPVYSPLDLFDPLVNSLAAFAIYQEAGYNFWDWTCNNILGYAEPAEKGKESTLLIALAFMLGIVLYFA